MTTAERKLEQLGIDITAAPASVGAYVPAVRSGSLVYTSGQLPFKDGQLLEEGKVPADVSLGAAQAAARQAAVNALAAIRGITGSLDRITDVIRLNVFVNSAPGFTDQAKVADGASRLLREIFGDPGKHTRCAVGAAELPLNAPVELDLIIEVS